MAEDRDAVLLDIAQRHFHVRDLVTRNSDRADHVETAVWAVKAALEEAYRAGRRSTYSD